MGMGASQCYIFCWQFMVRRKGFKKFISSLFLFQKRFMLGKLKKMAFIMQQHLKNLKWANIIRFSWHLVSLVWYQCVMRIYTTVGYVLMFNTKDQLGGYQVTPERFFFRDERLRVGLICIVKCNFSCLYHLNYFITIRLYEPEAFCAEKRSCYLDAMQMTQKALRAL